MKSRRDPMLVCLYWVMLVNHDYNTRIHCILIEHVDEERKSFDGYKSDPKAGEIAPYLVLHYQKIVEHYLVKHSKRPESLQVSSLVPRLSGGGGRESLVHTVRACA